MSRILVADDDSDLREFIAFTLEREGHDVVIASDGAEALDLYWRGGIDLVCTDLDMPGLNRTGVTQAIRAKPEDRVPILLITGSAKPGDIEEARAAGVSAVLSKPVEVRALRQTAARLLALEPTRGA